MLGKRNARRVYRLSLAAFVLFISSFASATATVSGQLVNPDTTGAIPSYVQFDLTNCGGNYPIVTGASISPRQTFTLANDGTWSGVMYRNDEITCNGASSTWWRMTYFVNSRQVGPARDFICSQSSCAFDSMTPLTVYPALPSPAPPTTSVLTNPVAPQTIVGGFALTNSGPFVESSTATINGAVTHNSTVANNGAVTNSSTTALNGVVTATAGLSANGQVTPQVYGAKADVVKLTDGAITSGAAAFTSASASFTVADVGKAIVVHGAGAAAADLVTTISARVSATAVTLAANAGTTSSAALTYYGTDDTAAIKSCVANGTALGGRCTLSNGSTYMSSNSTNTVSMSGTGTGGILDGSGTVIFAPTGALVGGVNDRFLYIRSTESGALIQVAAGAISKGATSFTANAAGDVSSWVKGDWIVLCEHDAGFGDCLYVDWVQVSSVSSATVNVITPFRMAFPNSRTWNVSGSPATCIVAAPCGLSARKITNITNATLGDFHLIIPKIPGGIVGIATRETRGLVIDNVTCDDASGNCFAGYLDQGLKTQKSFRINNAIASEIAGTVDIDVDIESQLVGTALNGFSAPAATCITFDIGSGMGKAKITCGPTGNVGIFGNGGVHDLAITGHVGWVKGTSPGGGFDCIGCYRVLVASSVFDGGDGSSTGIIFSDSSGYTVNINSDQNVATGNIVNGFPTNYSCAGTLGTDNCEVYLSSGLRDVRNAEMIGMVIGEGDVPVVNGANSNIVPPSGNGAQSSYIRLTGPTGAFSISGFTGGVNGRILYVFNSVAFAMTITNEATSTSGNRITTLTGADVVLRAGTSYATFIYEGASSRWKLVSTN